MGESSTGPRGDADERLPHLRSGLRWAWLATWVPYHRRSSGHHTIDKRRPIQVIVLAFLGAIVIGTGLLLLPAASTAETSPLEALFTSVSAICVTGLIVVDTVTHWTTFGQVVILVLIQLGGFGVMTAATVVSLVLSRQLGLETKYVAAVSTRTVRLGDVGKVLRGVARTTVIMEVATALMLTLRWWISYDEPFGRAVWLGVFHSVSAFNNAGFALFTDSLIGFESDPLIILPISAALIIGGLGFPVLLEIMRHYRWPHRWSLQARATAGMSLGLVLTGWLFVLAAEWGNPGTLGPLSVPGKILGAFFQGVVPRTAGFNSVDIAEMNTGTWFGLDILMFIGGGSAGTAGGIKVTTVAVLGYAIWSELRGDKDVRANRWRLSPKSIREALTVAALSAGLVVLSTGLMTYHEPFTLDEILFEVISAFGTVGLSTGITADLSAIHQVLLMALMFVGRLGPITLGSSLALRTRGRDYRNPETTMIIG